MIEKIKEILSNYTDSDMDKVTEDTDLINDLNLNSLDLMNIIVDFEDSFGVSIDDSEIADLSTIGDVIKALTDKGVVE